MSCRGERALPPTPNIETKIRRVLFLRLHPNVFGMFKAGYKPDARSYNVQREDIDHFLKHGETLHGEWWYEGKRIPRKGGHLEPLPAGMEEREREAPWAPELTHQGNS